MRDVVHAEVEPENNVGLVKRLAVEVRGEVNNGVCRVVVIERMSRAGFSVVLDRSIKVVCCEALRVQQVARVLNLCVNLRSAREGIATTDLDREIHATADAGHDAVAAVLAESVGLVRIDDLYHVRSSWHIQ